jgi:hypothetical protein
VNTSPFSRYLLSASSAAEHVALQQVLVVGLERRDGLVEAGRHRRDLRHLFCRHLVEILLERIPGRRLVADAVEARHQHGREGEIGVRRRVRVTHLHPLGRRVRRVDRNPAGGGAVPRRERENRRSFEARRQPLV